MTSSPYADLDRPPLSVAGLRRGLTRDAGVWRELRVLEETGSTNADAVAAARAGAPGGLVIVAEHQTEGRGRLDRAWSSPPRAGLTFSMVLRPPVDRDRWAVLPLLVAVAATDAITAAVEVPVQIKWPNDLLVADRKVAGLLAEVVGDAVVVGLGLNVSTRTAELPAGAASLALERGETVDRQTLLLALLRRIEAAYDEWLSQGGDPGGVLRPYRERSATLGREVRFALPDGGSMQGRAVEIDHAGRLVLAVAGAGRRAFAVGDVVHVAPSAG